MSRREKWAAGAGAVLVLTAVGVTVAGSILSRRFEPYIRDQAEQYLRTRFHADVSIAALHVHLPRLSPVRVLFTQGRGAMAWVDGENVTMRMKGRQDSLPLFTMRKFTAGVDLGNLFETPKHVPVVNIEGLQINIPPKGQRPDLTPDRSEADQADRESETNPMVIIDRVTVRDATLVMLPQDAAKRPLRFAIHDLNLQSAGKGVAMKYQALLTNPKPPGQIRSSGTFGPWRAGEPGDSRLSGDYTFDHADLGVFSGIAGILRSKGRFEGELDSIMARGEADVPDFRLKRSENRVPLHTQFEVLVDGTNGNTTLKPVIATLGSTRFTTSGAVFKNEGDQHRSIQLDVNMPVGHMRDVLHLAMKGPPFMEGELNLKTRLEIPPLSGKVKDKLRLDGRFDVTGGHFLKSTIQDQIDSLSRRGQGQPKNQEIDEVISRMMGSFKLENGVITFRDLTFGVPGADVHLQGDYDLDADMLDFHGALKLQAKVSQTMSGWKHWLLKPVDPFFSKHGAGTFLRIKVAGDSKAPKFGLDR
jgi:AsmA-like C-terminal region